MCTAFYRTQVNKSLPQGAYNLKFDKGEKTEEGKEREGEAGVNRERKWLVQLHILRLSCRLSYNKG